MDNLQKPVCFAKRTLSYLICALLAGQPVFPVFAAATPANNATQMDSAANGVPVVNIATPNGAGISHNQFQNYNVGKEGIILNNATGQLNQTQLGGLIQNNPNLQAGQEARGIINEVTGANRSQLNGFTEVAGKAANVMVANPYGITCNGCGFINTPNATLTTGKPVFDANGNLQSLDVTKGSVTVEGQGLNASQTDALSIISRATEVNAEIHAKALNVIAGSNRVGENGSVTAIAGDGATPVVAVDTGALGGMYANRIRLVSSDKGVGVNLGNLNARQGDITLDANGRLTVKNSLASGSLSAKGESVELTGEHKASGNINVGGQDIALNSGTFASDNNMVLNSDGKLTLASATLTAGNSLSMNAGEMALDGNSRADAARDITANIAGTANNQGQLVAGNNVVISGGSLTNSGNITANGTARIKASTLNNSGAVQSQGNMMLSGNALSNSGKMLAGGGLDVTAQTLHQSGTLSVTGVAHINATHALNNTASGQILSDDALAINAGNIQQSGTLSGKKSLAVAGNSLTTAGGSLSTSQGNISLNADDMNLDGEVIAHDSLAVQANTLTSQSHAQLQADGSLSLNASDATLNGTHVAKDSLTLTSGNVVHGGKTSAATVIVKANQTTNSGELAAANLAITSQDFINSGLLQGDQALNFTADSFENALSGTLYSKQNLALNIPTINNAGLIATDDGLILSGDTLINSGEISAASLALKEKTLNNSGLIAAQSGLEFKGDELVNSGEINAASLSIISEQLNNLNDGLLLSQGRFDVSSNSLFNAGQMAADVLSLNAKNLSNDGLWQGTSTLIVQGDELRTGSASRTLTGGELALDAVLLATGGTLQGQNVHITADGWTNSGSLLGTGLVDATISGVLDNSGDILSQGNATLSMQSLDNKGALLGAADLKLSGESLDNKGALQGNQLLLTINSLTSSGMAIGLQLLQFAGRELINGGQLLSGGALNINGESIINSGVWQGQNILLNAQQLANSGTIQSADSLTLKLSGDLTSAAGSKIIANGSAALQALSLTNNGQWLTGNLVINGTSLNNNGEISGVNGLVLALSGAFTQQQGKTLLSGGALNLSAATVSNAGQIQGANLRLNSGMTDNSGRIQANNDLTLSGNLSNGATGIVLSQNTLSLTTPDLQNYGLIQGSGSTRIDAANSVRNDGKMLSGGELTLNTSNLANNNWLQATSLLLTASTVNNGGTLFAASNLNIQADQFTHQAAGKLYSGGNLQLISDVFDQLGQVVALGNLTLKLSSAFTGKNVLAAGNVLEISSSGAISNQSVMQGQAVNLISGAELTNNGKITTGSGSSTLSGNGIAMNAAGTLQAGGDVALNSRDNITVDGFVGSASSLTLNAAGSILNTALLYAGNNIYLLANSIRNNHGDILAGNNLWMQRDMAGNANAEMVNTSGNIETVNGDIAINTGHLLNERDGLQVTSTYNEFAPDNVPYMDVYLSDLEADKLGIYVHTLCSGGKNTHCTTYYSLKPIFYNDQKKVLVNETETQVTANGGASRISAGRDLYAVSNVIDNNSSNLLASRDMYLMGGALNNNSAQTGKISTYQTFEYECRYACGYELEPFPDNTDVKKWISYHEYNADEYIRYVLIGTDRVSSLGESEIYRSVIQAGGNITANFTSDISNTTTTANTGGISNTITAPTLNTLSQPGSVSQQDLANADIADINSPQWHDSLIDAISNISGGSGLTDQQGQSASTSLYPLPSGNNGYFVTSSDPSSPYLITTNPKLDGLGELDQSLFGDLYALMGIQPGAEPRETNTSYTDQNKFLGSAYFLDRLNLHPEYDYRFLGDAAFDTRYVSNFMLNQTGNRYINGLGSDLEQMQYLMDNAAGAQQSLGLAFGVALTAEQIASLDSSILWWEAANVNGQTVMVPKVYLSPKDVTVNNGSVISGNNVQLAGGNVTNSGSITANNNLIIDSQNSINNLNAGLINAGGGLQLGALGDINNIGSTISGKTVQLESVGGSINNITQTEQWQAGGTGKRGESVSFSETESGPVAGIIAQDGMSLSAGKDINITGANVAAGGDLLMLAEGNINVTANQITDSESQSGFRGKDATSSESVTQQGSTISAGGNLGMQAGNDLTIGASQVNAGENAILIAGNDLNLNAAQTSETSSKGKSETHSTDNARTTITAGGDMALVAGQDINSQAAGLAAEGDVAMQAGRDVNLMAAETTDGDSYRAKKKVEINESVRQDSTEIASGGDTTIVAGRDVNSQAAQVTASGDIGIGAGRDINLDTATESDYHFKEETKTKSGFLNKTTTHTVEEDSATRESGTLLSGDNVTLIAGNDLLVKGSAVVGDGNVSLNAGNNIDIVAATNTDSTYRLEEKKKSGLMGTGGIGVTIGSASSRHEINDEGTTQSQSFSTIGSTGGDVSINAGGQAHIGGADIIAGKDLSLRGDSVLIEPGRDQRTQDESFEQKQSGLTIALSGAAGSAVNSAVSAAQSAESESDDRLAALKLAQGVMSGTQAGQALALDAVQGNDPANSNTIGISASLGTQSSKSESHSGQSTATGSTLTAGDSVSITATGGDITAIGSQIKAGLDVALNAADDINLISSQNTQWLEGENKSSGGAIGVGIGVGSGGAGINISASGNASKGSESGNGKQHIETTIDAGNQVSLISGNDTTIAGAQVSGNSVVADIGGDLSISSLQDSDQYDSSQKSISGGASFSFGTMTGSGSINVSNDKMHSDYNSVTEQSGIFAGDGGFDITVGGHTQLDGAVIASTGSADKNHLDTGTLGFSDIGNKAEFDTEHQGAGISTGGSIAENFIGNMANGVVVGAGGEGEAEGTTKAAISAGEITVRDREKQQQDVADLSRDVEHANGSISPIFDKEKEQKRLEIAQALGDVGSQAADIARTAGEIKGLEAAKAAHPELSGKALLETKEYKDTQKQYGTGSDIQQGISAATMALQGLAGGDMAAALAGGAAPYLAEQIKKQVGEDNVAANAIAHAIVGGVVAELQGRDAGAGAAGAATGELIAQVLYPGVKREDLDETQKQKIVALSTLAAGLAGGLAGDDTASIIAGAQGGKNAVENNFLGTEEDQIKAVQRHGADVLSCADNPSGAACQRGIAENKAYAGALAAAGLIYLPGGMQVTAGIGGTANAGIQYAINGSVNPTDVLIASYVGAFTAETGLWGTMGWNAAGGATSSYLNGDDPFKGGVISGAASGLGYGIGKFAQGSLNNIFNPNWKSYEWVDKGMGISKPLTPSSIPSIAGNTGAAIATEGSGAIINEQINSLQEKK